ncbi:hypothetical protein MLP_00860 [Microlunatus phosphovorus NM-1]|uniref:Uncharacterized protein n=1 Tax=Microlunatus phosphovorus (strain ATCC 700054 / DSM 10555 / JCM 9379 / NBRC 101784 / NCIMB 13414 / VKM Ac-1990 / NM-1) TaxID=1032480 RepID=F5XGJ3_MICPN|nr:hypothetical protein MLP_00860 [Microlunatus phosphovorus NM-1]
MVDVGILTLSRARSDRLLALADHHCRFIRQRPQLLGLAFGKAVAAMPSPKGLPPTRCQATHW